VLEFMVRPERIAGGRGAARFVAVHKRGRKLGVQERGGGANLTAAGPARPCGWKSRTMEPGFLDFPNPAPRSPAPDSLRAFQHVDHGEHPAAFSGGDPVVEEKQRVQGAESVYFAAVDVVGKLEAHGAVGG